MRTMGWLICFALLITSCATTRTHQGTTQLQPDEIAELLQKRSDELVSLHADGSLSSSAHGSTDQAQFIYDLYRTDSLLLTLYGPFGILVGKLQANPEGFSFFDALNNEIYEGASSRENFERILRIPLSQREMAALLRGEPLHPVADFELVEPSATFPIFVLRRDGIAERMIFSHADSAMTEYARKNAAGETILLVRYSEFETINNIHLAHKVTFQFPKAEISVNLQSSSVSVNAPDRKYSFMLPKGIKRNRF